MIPDEKEPASIGKRCITSIIIAFVFAIGIILYISSPATFYNQLTILEHNSIVYNYTDSTADYIKNDKIVLIAATGRSGSTTMQLILNTIPNSNICGETWAAVMHLLQFYQNLKKSSTKNIPGRLTPYKYDYFIKNSYKPAWYNSYNFSEIRESIRKTIVDMYKIENVSVWGFKEIRYCPDSNMHLIAEFKELFPKTKVIVHTRQNITKQSQSSWWARNPSRSERVLLDCNSRFKQFYENNTDYVFFSTFEDMFDHEKVERIFDFLGEDFNQTAYQNIIQTQYRNPPNQNKVKINFVTG